LALGQTFYLLRNPCFINLQRFIFYGTCSWFVKRCFGQILFDQRTFDLIFFVIQNSICVSGRSIRRPHQLRQEVCPAHKLPRPLQLQHVSFVVVYNFSRVEFVIKVKQYFPKGTSSLICPTGKSMESKPGNTKGGSITVPLTSCLTGLD
jgi:hypothetical protein